VAELDDMEQWKTGQGMVHKTGVVSSVPAPRADCFDAGGRAALEEDKNEK